MLTRVRPTDEGREVVRHQNDDQIYCDDFCWHFGSDDEAPIEPGPIPDTVRQSVIHTTQQSALQGSSSPSVKRAEELEDQGTNNYESNFKETSNSNTISRRIT